MVLELDSNKNFYLITMGNNRICPWYSSDNLIGIIIPYNYFKISFADILTNYEFKHLLSCSLRKSESEDPLQTLLLFQKNELLDFYEYYLTDYQFVQVETITTDYAGFVALPKVWVMKLAVDEKHQTIYSGTNHSLSL